MNERAKSSVSPLARKLKLIRVGLGLSQNEILNQMGFGHMLFRSNISQYERGLRVPSPKLLLAYSRLAKVDLAVLIDDELELEDRFVDTKHPAGKK
ncbi:MAG TPA: helix-turn-helix transcriptional regulator [Pyrinomonadaceae bacterium]